MSRTFVLCESVTLIRSTDKAGMYRIDGEEVWISWSQIRDDSVDTDGKTGDLWITKWIAEQKDIEWEEEEDE